jgi:hypothetical protein
VTVVLFVDLTCDLTRSILGTSMHNLACKYSNLGRHQDSLVLREKTLEFQRRVLPVNHPDIVRSCFDISFSYRECGDFHRALQSACEALRMWQATLPLSHPYINRAKQLIQVIEGDIARRA